jgi:hypothetical protein
MKSSERARGAAGPGTLYPQATELPEGLTPFLVPRAAADRLPGLPAFEKLARSDRDWCFENLGYTFWSAELLERLAGRLSRLGPGAWLEVAAGNGRLAAELTRRGVPVAATDSYVQHPDRVRSAQRPIRYPEWVHELDAFEAIERLRPIRLLCAWPPFGSALIPRLLGDPSCPGSEALEWIVCIGEPEGASELCWRPDQLTRDWALAAWPECERLLVGFCDPTGGREDEGRGRLLVYRRLGHRANPGCDPG